MKMESVKIIALIVSIKQSFQNYRKHTILGNISNLKMTFMPKEEDA